MGTRDRVALTLFLASVMRLLYWCARDGGSEDRRRAAVSGCQHALDGGDEVEGEATFVDASVGSRLECAR